MHGGRRVRRHLEVVRPHEQVCDVNSIPANCETGFGTIFLQPLVEQEVELLSLSISFSSLSFYPFLSPLSFYPSVSLRSLSIHLFLLALFSRALNGRISVYIMHSTHEEYLRMKNTTIFLVSKILI